MLAHPLTVAPHTSYDPGARVSVEPFFGHWMVAVAEAAAIMGVESLDEATPAQMAEAWDLVAQASGLTLIDLAEAIAAQHHLKSADVAAAERTAARVVPGPLAWRRLVFPLRATERELVVATSNPLSIDTKRELARTSGRAVDFEVAPPRDITAELKRHYGPPSPEDLRPRPSVDEPTGPHILVVDDEPGVRALYRSILEAHGFRVSVAKDGPDALAKLTADPACDLVTLDYWMDKMNGLRVLQQMQANPALAHIPVIVVTGADNRAIELSLFEAGADDFITKPIDIPLFVLRIRAVLRRRRLR
jgi:CheY-like chemotaxis protein